MATDVFRKVSLERLSSPEQLDQLLEVTSSRSWLALAAVGALLVAAGVWSVIGNLPERVSGQGILIRSGGISETPVPMDGRVSDLAVRVGDDVTQGQVVGRLAQEGMIERLAEARAELSHRKQELDQLVTFSTRDATLQQQVARERRNSLDQALTASNEMLRSLDERAAAQDDLATRGLITRQTLLATREQVETTRERIRSARGELRRLQLQELEDANQRAKDIRTAELRVQQARAEVSRLEQEVKANVEVVAPHAGRVLEIMAAQGDIVSRGQPILSINRSGKAFMDLEAVVYVPSFQGKRVRAGMPIEITPATVRKEEVGYMIGTVTYVSAFPATPGGMRHVLKNEQLVTALSGQDAPYEIRADLIPDPAAFSRYKWSSSHGPPVKIESGTLAAGDVIVSSRRPVEVLVPVTRGFFGSR